MRLVNLSFKVARSAIKAGSILYQGLFLT